MVKTSQIEDAIPIIKDGQTVVVGGFGVPGTPFILVEALLEQGTKILTSCTLPLTAKSWVDRIITELAVIDVVDDRLVLIEIAREASVEEIIGKTSAPLTIPDRELPQF